MLQICPCVYVLDIASNQIVLQTGQRVQWQIFVKKADHCELEMVVLLPPRLHPCAYVLDIALDPVEEVHSISGGFLKSQIFDTFKIRLSIFLLEYKHTYYCNEISI